jgi:hypothetical protein
LRIAGDGRVAVAKWLRRTSRSPLAWVLAGACALYTIGIGWGLPGSDGWDDDGIAPRDFLVGACRTYWPPHYFTYPPVHLVLLAILTLPVTLIGLARAASWSPHDVVAELIRVPYMTMFAVVARVVTALMAIGIVCTVARIVEELWGRRAGIWAAAVLALNVVFTYYAHTSNLDVPYLFWTLLAVLSIVRSVLRHEPQRLKHFALFCVLAVGTKDQAYAVFLLSVPIGVAYWLGADPWARANWRSIVRELAISSICGAALLLLVDGALVNPSGFVERMRFLAGPASQDHANYAPSLAGRVRVLMDSASFFGRFYPLGLAPLVGYGLYLHVVRTRGEPARAVAGLLPLLAMFSFAFAFNCVARRTEHRFLLPESIFAAFYGGLALDALTSHGPGHDGRSRVAWQAAGWLVTALLGGRALFECAGVDVALLRDPRYEAEAWLSAHVMPGEVIEVYGNNAYLPRLPSSALVVRLDTSPIAARSPMPGMQESEEPYDLVEQRRPDWIVLSEGWVWRYTFAPPDPSIARTIAPIQVTRQHDVAARAYFASLFAGTGAYAEAHVARYDDRFWPRVDIHASTTRSIYVFHRTRR